MLSFPSFSNIPRHSVQKEQKTLNIFSRALALLLFGLKYLYGLDGVTEKFVSASARHSNSTLDREEDEDRKKGKLKKFVFCDWLRLSRERLFLAVRHCHIIREIFLGGEEEEDGGGQNDHHLARLIILHVFNITRYVMKETCVCSVVLVLPSRRREPNWRRWPQSQTGSRRGTPS